MTTQVKAGISLPFLITCVDQSMTVETSKHDQRTHDENWDRAEPADSYGEPDT